MDFFRYMQFASIFIILSWEVMAVLFAIRSYVFKGINYKNNRASVMFLLSLVVFLLGLCGISGVYNATLGTYDSTEVAHSTSAIFAIPFWVQFIIFLMYFLSGKDKKRFFGRITSDELRNLGLEYDKFDKGVKCAMFRGYKVLFDKVDMPIFEGGAELGIEQIDEEYYSCVYFRADRTRNKWAILKVVWGYTLLVLDMIEPFVFGALGIFGIFSICFLICCHLCRFLRTFEIKFILILINVLICITYYINVVSYFWY